MSQWAYIQQIRSVDSILLLSVASTKNIYGPINPSIMSHPSTHVPLIPLKGVYKHLLFFEQFHRLTPHICSEINPYISYFQQNLRVFIQLQYSWNYRHLNENMKILSHVSTLSPTYTCFINNGPFERKTL